MITTYHVKLDDIGPVDVTIDEQGEGRPILLLHGGGGPDTVAGFGALLAAAKPARVIRPVHPGFAGTLRPEALDTVGGLAALYVALLDQLGVDDVIVVGNSIGGWIAAEMALLSSPLSSPRVSGIILVDACGIEVPEHPAADFFSLRMDQVFPLSFHNPGPFRIDPSTLPPAAQAAAAANRAALVTYSKATMGEPTLAGRLSAIETPTLVLWGDSDQIVDPGYGRAFAAAIPGARFQLLTDTGHLPQIETPDQVLQAVWDFAGTGSAS
jgi:pimeloyl-ACP methyl ester carboxylesterase